jgi:vancomycin resistance protein YoaR
MSDQETVQPNLVGAKTYHTKKIIIAIGAALVLLALFFGVAVVYSKIYENKVLPGVYVRQYHMGSLTETQVKEIIENFNNRIAKENLNFNFNNNGTVQSFTLNVVSTEDSSVEMVKADSQSTVTKLLAVGRSGNFWSDLWQPLYLRFFSPVTVRADIVLEDRLMSNLETYMLAFDDLPRNANIKITDLMPLSYSLEAEKSGFVFDYETVKNTIVNELSALSLQPITIPKKEFRPDVVVADLESLVPRISEVLNYGDLRLNYTDPQTDVKRNWSVGPTVYTPWLEVRRENGEPVFALNKEKVKNYLETLRPLIETAPQDAKFVMEGDRVKEFQANQTGLSLNAEKTYADLDAIFRERNYHPAELAKTVTVSVDIVEPNIVMANINNLGIMEKIGTGFSTFKDSHTNRIKNIANAVKRLNGILIKPGEEFSANKYAGPYTLANGFLPEQVIKGNEIKPEVGGGMCQIGTTLFRTAMNSGMPITERRNHSLVVGYYADPVNGNPGTDSTLYEPSVDFKFVNDTGNYLLLQTSIDYVKQQLVFTLWGKSDGRSGSYTHPIVSKWIPAGAPQNIISKTLKPGETKCQAAFRGAVASFVYTRFTSTSEKIERVFDSYYRPLPKICMVGPAVVSSTPGSDVPLDLGEGN